MGRVGSLAEFTAIKSRSLSEKSVRNKQSEGANMNQLIGQLWRRDRGQDIAEYAVMLAVILVLVVGAVQLVGSNSNTVFSNVASSIQ
jgi:Flp pilus assembly pilin Flp